MLSLDFSRHGIRAMGIAALMLAAFLPCPMAHAQADLQVRGVPSPDSDVPLQFSGDAASIPTGTPSFHILRANNEAGRQAPLDWPLPQSKPNAAARHTPLAGLPRPGFFPADLSNLGGLVLLSGGSI